MSQTISYTHSDTTVPSGIQTNWALPSLNYGTDFRVESNKPDEVVLTNVTTQLDRPERLRFAYNKVANVYTGTGIDRALWYPSTRGVSLLNQRTDVLAITDPDDSTYLVLVPIEAHTVVKVPVHPLITSEVVEYELKRLASGWFDPAQAGRLNSMLRGALTPSSL